MEESNKLPTSKKLSSRFNNPARNKVQRIFLPHNKKQQANKKVERNTESTDTEENSKSSLPQARNKCPCKQKRPVKTCILTGLPELGKIMPWVSGLLPPRSHQLSSRKESWLDMRCSSHLWYAAISTKVNKNELWMMRFNFAYVVPKLCQVHSNAQMKIFPVSISTPQSRNCMSNMGKTHMELCSSFCTHHQDAPR